MKAESKDKLRREIARMKDDLETARDMYKKATRERDEKILECERLRGMLCKQD